MLQLATLRSNDQFNTTIYGYTDRFRGIEGTRHVIFMNAADISRRGLEAGQAVDITTAIDEGKPRTVVGFQIVPYDIPEGCAGAYFPEANPLIPISHHDPKSKVPGYKALPVRVRKSLTGRVPHPSHDGFRPRRNELPTVCDACVALVVARRARHTGGAECGRGGAGGAVL